MYQKNLNASFSEPDSTKDDRLLNVATLQEILKVIPENADENTAIDLGNTGHFIVISEVKKAFNAAYTKTAEVIFKPLDIAQETSPDFVCVECLEDKLCGVFSRQSEKEVIAVPEKIIKLLLSYPAADIGVFVNDDQLLSADKALKAYRIEHPEIDIPLPAVIEAPRPEPCGITHWIFQR